MKQAEQAERAAPVPQARTAPTETPVATTTGTTPS
jgi:hypothetical protein